MNAFMREAILLSKNKMLEGEGGPFGAIVVKDGTVIGRGFNKVTSSADPTAHAEIVAIREACQALGDFHLDGCELYTSCEPCPMCLGAIYWARISKVYYANTREDAASIGFDDAFIYREIDLSLDARRIPMVQIMREEAREAFALWREKGDRKEY